MERKEKDIKKKITAIIIIILLLFFVLLAIINAKGTVYTVTVQNGQEISILKTDKEGRLEEPEEPTKDGYVFLGWYIERGVQDEKVDFSKPFDKDTKIEARWEANRKEEVPGSELEVPEEIETEEIEEETQEQEDTTKKPVSQKPQKPQKPQESEKVPQPEESQTVEVNSLVLSSTKLKLEVGENNIITVTVNPSNATDKIVVWKSSNAAVATVDSSGKIIAVGEGTSIITATVGEKTVSCEVIVKNKVTYSVEWVKVEGTAIEQYKLYIKSSEGEYVSGTLELTTIAGATFEEQVTSNGSANVYIKSAIKSVKIK